MTITKPASTNDTVNVTQTSTDDIMKSHKHTHASYTGDTVNVMQTSSDDIMKSHTHTHTSYTDDIVKVTQTVSTGDIWNATQISSTESIIPMD